MMACRPTGRWYTCYYGKRPRGSSGTPTPTTPGRGRACPARSFAMPPLFSLLCRECVLPLCGGLRAGRPTISLKRDYVVGAAYMPPAPPLSKGGGRACEAGGIPAALPLPPFCPAYPFTSFTSFSPLANARAFSIVVMAMLCNAVRVKNA